MGRFVNPDNSAFQVALNSKIYIDKTGLFLIRQMHLFVTAVHADLVNLMQRIC